MNKLKDTFLANDLGVDVIQSELRIGSEKMYLISYLPSSTWNLLGVVAFIRAILSA